MRKKFIACMTLLSVLLSLALPVFADTFNITNAYSSYSGWYRASEKKHCTSYAVNAGGAVEYRSGVQVLSNSIEYGPWLTTGISTIVSKYKAGEFAQHSHYKFER